jgi:hypothetical protein
MTPKSIANFVTKSAAVAGLAFFIVLLAGCSGFSPNIGVSVPIGGFGSVGVSVGAGGVTGSAGISKGGVSVGASAGTGGVSGSAGVGTSVGGVNVGGSVNTNGTVSGNVGGSVGGATVGVGASGQIAKPAEKKEEAKPAEAKQP